jgi:hypothetical protein
MKKVQKKAGMAVYQLLVLLFVAMQANAQPASQKTMAVLPIHYIGDATDEMRYRLQDMAYDYLRDHSAETRVQNPFATNALLAKSQITADNLRAYTPSELAEILGVDYVVTGRITQEYAGGISNMRSTQEGNRHRHDNRHGQQMRSQVRNTELYNTYIELDIFDNKGESIYSKSRKSILYDVDAYKNGLHYLLKRSPLVKK